MGRCGCQWNRKGAKSSESREFCRGKPVDYPVSHAWAEFRKAGVTFDVLLSENHAEIARWRIITKQPRGITPDHVLTG